MKFLIITVWDDALNEGATYDEINRLTRKSKEDYALKYNYDTLFVGHTVDSSRVISWSKTKLAIENLDKYDWIWCVDADLMIMNDNVTLESLVEGVTEDIIVAKSPRNTSEVEINTGSILIKNSEWNKYFLQEVYRQDQFSQHRWAEQIAMMHLIKTIPSVAEHFKFVDFRIFNSMFRYYPECNYQPGDFVIHLAGRGNQERYCALKSIEEIGKVRWSLNDFTKNRKHSIYSDLIHDTNPYEGIDISNWTATNDRGGLDMRIFNSLFLNAGGDGIGLIVEVGSWVGGSAIAMAKELKSRGNVHTDILCIDTWNGSLAHWENPDFKTRLALKNGRPTLYDQFMKNVVANNVEDYIIPFPVSSVDGAKYLVNKKVKSDIVFIDASHEFEDVYNDIINHWQHLKAGGIMCGDDFEPAYSGVMNAVAKFANENNLPVYNSDQGNEWILFKPK